MGRHDQPSLCPACCAVFIAAALPILPSQDSFVERPGHDPMLKGGGGGEGEGGASPPHHTGEQHIGE